MKDRELLLLALGVSAALVAGFWWSRRAGAAALADRFAPDGFTWDRARGQYVKPDGRGGAEVYARDVFL